MDTNRILTLLILSVFVTGGVEKIASAQAVPLGMGQGRSISSMNSTTGWNVVYGSTMLVLNTSSGAPYGDSLSVILSPNATVNNAGAVRSAINTSFNNASNFYFWFYIGNNNNLNATEGVSFQYTTDQWLSSTSCIVPPSAFQSGWTPVVIAKDTCIPYNNPSTTNNVDSIEFRVPLNHTDTDNVLVNINNLRAGYAGGLFNKAQVVLTFDGSWNSTILNASPIMAANHQTGVAYIVTNQINDPGVNNNATGNYGCGGGQCITSNQMQALSALGWDVASHTVNHADLVNETSDEYPSGINNTYELTASQQMLVANDAGATPLIFAYPNGAYDNLVIQQVQQAGYLTARALGYGLDQPNMFAGDPYNLNYRVQSVVMENGTSMTAIENNISKVEAENGLLVLTFHIILQPDLTGKNYQNYTVPCFESGVCYTTSDFRIISNYLEQQECEGNLQVTNFSAYFNVIDNGASGDTTVPSWCGGGSTTTTSTSTTTTVSTTTVNTTTTIPASNTTTTIPPCSSCGGGSPSGGLDIINSGGGSGSSILHGGGSIEKPVLVNTSNSILVYNLTADGTFNATFCGVKYVVVDNFITPNGTGMTFNNQGFGLNLGSPDSLSGNCIIELVNESYIPYLHTVEIGFFNTPPQKKTTNTVVGNVIIPVVNSTTTIKATTTIPVAKSSNTVIEPIVVPGKPSVEARLYNFLKGNPIEFLFGAAVVVILGLIGYDTFKHKTSGNKNTVTKRVK